MNYKGLVLAACLFLVGCAEEYVRLDQAQLDEITQRAGALSTDNLDAWLKAASVTLDAQVTGVAETAKGTIVKLASLGQDLTNVGVTTVAERAAGIWAPAGLMGAVGTAGALMLKRLISRGKLNKVESPK